MAKNKKKKKKSRKIAKEFIRLSFTILVAVVLVYLLTNYVVSKNVVHSVSMENTLYEGDTMLLDRISYRFRDVKRGDVICFKSYGAGENLIKRVIGLPGERILIKYGSVYINSEKYEDDDFGPTDFGGTAGEYIVLGKDEYFVLGDNREKSIDSRYPEIGNVKKDDIIGKAWLLYYPFDRIRIIK